MAATSKMIISQTVIAFSAIMFAICEYKNIKCHSFNKTCLAVAVWLLLEILSDYIATSFSEEVTAVEAARYYLILASAALSMMAITHVSGDYPKTIKISFTAITFICVAMAFYRWVVQSRWDEGGANFYASYGVAIDSIFVYSIAAMDALMIILGVYSALADNNNTDDRVQDE